MHFKLPRHQLLGQVPSLSLSEDLSLKPLAGKQASGVCMSVNLEALWAFQGAQEVACFGWIVCTCSRLPHRMHHAILLKTRRPMPCKLIFMTTIMRLCSKLTEPRLKLTVPAIAFSETSLLLLLSLEEKLQSLEKFTRLEAHQALVPWSRSNSC